MEDEVLKKLDKYYERFNDAFPTMELPEMSDKELIAAINKCLKQGKKAQDVFKIRYDKGIFY